MLSYRIRIPPALRSKRRQAVVKSIHRIVWCVAVPAMFGLIMPAIAMAAGRGPRSSAGSSRSQGVHSRPVASQKQPRQHTAVALHHRGGSGPLSYNAYWRAATSPNPPKPNQDYNRYWQKMQAWQQYQQRKN
jgi:hypothetical protein